jgi:hypothetical protein
VQQDAGKVQAKLIAFLDDASRVVCHGEFFANDTTEALLACFKSALYKRGLCEVLYVDNGSNYSSLEISQVCERLGTILCHTPVRDGAAKACASYCTSFVHCVLGLPWDRRFHLYFFGASLPGRS